MKDPGSLAREKHSINAKLEAPRLWISSSSSSILLCVLTLIVAGVYHTVQFIHVGSGIDQITKCTVRSVRANTNGLAFLNSAKPIQRAEFLDRRNSLAQALAEESYAKAFIFEPGFSASPYYANFSQRDWEPWEPEERPLLGVVLPISGYLDTTKGIRGRLVFLSPKFEADRLRMIKIPNSGGENLDVITWEEHQDPYATLRDHLFDGQPKVKIMVDDEMRHFIVQGLQKAGFDTVGMSSKLQEIQQIKSPAEIEILRAVNTGTVEAVRAAQKCLIPRLRERDVIKIVDDTLRNIGFSPFFNLVLFDENAALPHGGVPEDKTLTAKTMVLIDVGAHYLGYSSDVSRSFFLPNDATLTAYLRNPTRLFRDSRPVPDLEKYMIWNLVFTAQAMSIVAMTPGSSASSVDGRARSIIEYRGYGQYFTHRVGHGLGIKAHEPPYLHKENAQLLRAGMVITSEPGIYLPGKFGVRLEDVFLITNGSEPELLTGKRAESPWKP